MSSREFVEHLFRMAATSFLEHIGYYDDGLAVEELLAERHTRKAEVVWCKGVVVSTLLAMGWHPERIGNLMGLHRTTVLHYRDNYVQPYGFQSHIEVGKRFAEEAKAARVPIAELAAA